VKRRIKIIIHVQQLLPLPQSFPPKRLVPLPHPPQAKRRIKMIIHVQQLLSPKRLELLLHPQFVADKSPIRNSSNYLYTIYYAKGDKV
jgi:hypothetical protein